MVKRADRLEVLGRIAGMASDARIAQLRRAAQACAQTEADLRALDAAQLAQEAGDVATLAAAAGYQRWIMERRAALNMRLAAQRADRDRCEAAARKAFGRARALDAVIARAAPRRRVE